MGTKTIFKVGDRFCRLVVTGDAGISSKVSYSFCTCDCGTHLKVQNKKLKNGHTRSCGCLKLELLIERSTTHGMSELPEYGVWQDIKKRCFNRRHKFWDYYGGRGITICAEWKDSFKTFYADMGKRPFKGAEVDRELNDGDYTPSNCRWVTRIVNMRNTRFNRVIEYDGESRCIAEWAELYNIKAKMLWDRLDAGWEMGKALTVPAKGLR